MATLAVDWPPPSQTSAFVEDFDDGKINIIVPSFYGHRCTFNRKADEPAQKTLSRISATFQKKLRAKGKRNGRKTKKEPNDDGVVRAFFLTPDHDRLPEGILSGTSLHNLCHIAAALLVTGIPGNPSTECCFTLKKNVPSVKDAKCFIKSAPMIHFPLAPTVALSFATECSYQWEVAKTGFQGEVVSTDPVFAPLPEHLGMRLSVTITPVNDSFSSSSSSSSSTKSKDDSTVRPAKLNFDYPIQDLPVDLKAMPWKRRVAKAQNSPNSFRIMSYNILADVYTKLNPPTHLKSTPAVYAMDYRQNLILAELLACACDVIALQECERGLFEKFLLPHMRYRGYDGLLQTKHIHGGRKADGMSTVIEDGCEGCAMFWRKSRLELCQSRGTPISLLAARDWDKLCAFFAQEDLYTTRDSLDELLEIGSVVQLCAFRCGDSLDEDKHLIVAGTHLYHHSTGEIIRAVQGYLVARESERFRVEAGLSMESTGFILAGDFNATPETFTVQGLRNGCLTAGCLTAQAYCDSVCVPDNTGNDEGKYAPCNHKRGNKPVEWRAVDWMSSGQTNLPDSATVLTHNLCLSSCYDAFLNHPCCEFPLTTYSLGFEGTLDWVFFSSHNLRMLQLWEGHSTKLLAQPALPSLLFPSDHIPVVVELIFK